jgi:hypothetical protein
MYNGVLALILGEAWLFGSMSLLKYALLVFVLSTSSSFSTRSLLSHHSSVSLIGCTGEQCRPGASPRGHFKRAPGGYGPET